MTDEKPTDSLLTRRDAILRVSAMLGGIALVGQGAMLAGCGDSRDAAPKPDASPSGLFSAADIELLDEIADTMLPDTETPGARAAAVGPFMALMVNATYRAPEQAIFVDGLESLDLRAQQKYGKTFMTATPAERLGLLEKLDREQYDYMRTREPDLPVHYFRMMKELALLGYFTSEIGYTRALRYSETPGRYEPCVPYTPGDPAWAEHA